MDRVLFPEASVEDQVQDGDEGGEGCGLEG